MKILQEDEYVEESSTIISNEIRLNSPLRISDISNAHDLVVLKALLDYGPLTLVDLQKRSHIPRTTIFDTLQRLLLAGYIVKTEKHGLTRGRPSTVYQVIVALQ